MEEIIIMKLYQSADGKIMLAHGTGCIALEYRQILGLGIEVESLLNFSQELFDKAYNNK